MEYDFKVHKNIRETDMDVYFNNGRRTALGPELKRGGEGCIHEFVENRGKFAKIYLSDADAKKEKILKMLMIGGSPKFEATHLHESLAWPRADLYDAKGQFTGFGMDKIESIMDLNDLYVSPPTPQNENVTMTQKITSLVSLCNIVSRLHRIGVVIGDFNPDNIKVMTDYTVKLVDTDNFHLGNSADMRCVACFPGYVAPEILRVMHNHTYADCPSPTFTANSDNFALAIHIFQMFFNGCHPYKQKRVAHYSKGSPPAAKKEDQCVEAGECLFFKPQANLRTPYWAPETKHFPAYLTDLFMRSFIDGHNDPTLRPSPDEWVVALERYKQELKTCNSKHSYWREATTCPYCEAEDRRRRNTTPVTAAQATVSPAASALSNTATTQSRPIAPPVTQYTAPSNSGNTGIGVGLYWFLSVSISLGVILLFITTFLKDLNHSIASDVDILSRDSVLLLILSGATGFLGVFIYNKRWSPRRDSDYFTGLDVVLSTLTSAGFTLLGFFALVIVVEIVDAVVTIIGYVIVIGIIIAAMAGG